LDIERLVVFDNGDRFRHVHEVQVAIDGFEIEAMAKLFDEIPEPGASRRLPRNRE
jgi:hypothetical protein